MKNILVVFSAVIATALIVNSCNNHKAEAQAEAQATAQAEAEAQRVAQEAKQMALTQAEEYAQAQAEEAQAAAEAQAQAQATAQAEAKCYQTLSQQIANNPGELVSFEGCNGLFHLNHSTEKWELISPNGDKVLVMYEKAVLGGYKLPETPYIIVDLSQGWEWFVFEEEVVIEVFPTETPQTFSSSCRWEDVPNESYYTLGCSIYRGLGGGGYPNTQPQCTVKSVERRVCDLP